MSDKSFKKGAANFTVSNTEVEPRKICTERNKSLRGCNTEEFCGFSSGRGLEREDGDRQESLILAVF